MKNTPLKYRLNVIGGGLIIFVCLRLYLPQLARMAGLGANFNIWLLVCMATLVLACILPIAFIERMCDFHPMLFKKQLPQTKDLLMVMGSMFIFTALAMVNSILVTLLGKVGIVFPAQTLEPINSTLTLVLYFVYSAVIPAIFEELFMRGIVLNLLLPNGRRFAVITSALIFTVMHTQVQSFIPVFGAGIVLACIYLYTGNIYVSMLLHFVNNAYSFIILYMQQRVNGISAMGFASFVMAVIIVGGGCSLWWMKKNGITLFESLQKNGKNSKVSKIFTCPIMVLGLLCCLMAVFAQLYADLAV